MNISIGSSREPLDSVISDHKPLEFIWQKGRPPLRIERWGLRLQPYNMVIKYRPGAENPADYMSRHPARSNIIRSREQHMTEHYVNALASVATPMVLTVDEVKRETAKDATLQVVIKLVQTDERLSNCNHEHSTETRCRTSPRRSPRIVKDKGIDTNESVVSRDRRSGRRIGEMMRTVSGELNPS